MRWLLLFALLFVTSANAWNLTWQDNSTNETEFIVERHDGSCGAGTFVEVGRVPANAQNFSDTDATLACYRVGATNGTLTSWSNEADSGPFVAPNAPGALQVSP